MISLIWTKWTKIKCSSRAGSTKIESSKPANTNKQKDYSICISKRINRSQLPCLSRRNRCRIVYIIWEKTPKFLATIISNTIRIWSTNKLKLRHLNYYLKYIIKFHMKNQWDPFNISKRRLLWSTIKDLTNLTYTWLKNLRSLLILDK